MMQASGIENIFSVEELRRARDVVAPELIRLVTERPEVVVLSADMGPVVAELRERFPQRYLEFGCEGQAGKIKGENLQVVAGKYAKGELAQVVH